jgi:hypothetical protein
MKNKRKNMKQYIDIPEGGQDISVDGEPAMSLSDYATSVGAEYTPESSEYYGLLVWPSSHDPLTSVEVDNEPVDVLSGAHPTQKPKTH